MSGIVGSFFNHKGSGIIAKLGTDGHTFNSGGAGKKAITEAVVVVADGVDGSKIADDAVESEHYADGSIDNAHIADDAIDSEHYADGSIDNAHIADDAIDSEHYAAGSIDNAHLADDAVDSDELAAGAVDTAHIADNQVTLAKMAGLARGKLIYGDSGGDPAALAVGSADQVLTHDGTDLSWEDAGGASTAHDGVGTYHMLFQLNTTNTFSDGTLAGSSLLCDKQTSATAMKLSMPHNTNSPAAAQNTAHSGTWRNMNHHGTDSTTAAQGAVKCAGLWVRIS